MNAIDFRYYSFLCQKVIFRVSTWVFVSLAIRTDDKY